MRSDGRRMIDALILIDERWAAEGSAAYDLVAQTLEHDLGVPVAVCFMGTPTRSARARIEALVAAGKRRIVVLPLFSEIARQTTAELAGLLRWARPHWLDTQFALAEPLRSRQHLIALLVRRAGETFATITPSLSQAETALLIVAPGSNEPEENAAWFAIARQVWEGRMYGWVEVAFQGATNPDLASALARSVRLGARQVIILPTCLNTGVTYSQAGAQVQLITQHFDNCRLLLAEPLTSNAALIAIIRQHYHTALQRLANGDDGVPNSTGHSHGSGADTAQRAIPAGLAALLPPRYQDGSSVSAAPMGAAALRYDADGQVAWEDLWTDFCDLALAGGPAHRGSLLEPVTSAEVLAEPAGYARVHAEMERGLRLVTRLPVVQSSAPGWIGVVCASEEMALWLLRAIVVENISVRREGPILFLPVGPAFHLEHEIKSVVTVMAKTVHYWIEHRATLGRE